MTTDINAQMTEYLISQFSTLTGFDPSRLIVEYNADDERTTIGVRHHSGDLYEYYDCVAGSDDDAFVFVSRTAPDQSTFQIEFPDADWFNNF